MKRVSIVIGLMFVVSVTGFTQSAGIAIAYFDAERLTSKGRQTELYDFKYFLPLIQQVIKRDFPNIEYKLVEQGEMVNLPDGSRFSVTTAKAPMGIVLSAKGKKRVELRGVQTDNDFGCAASTFFHRPSPACPKKK